jgi:hypothetical protein
MTHFVAGKEAALSAIRLALAAGAAVALLLAPDSCRLSPVAPAPGTGESAAIDFGNTTPAGYRPEAPPIGAVDIAREGDRVRFSIGILPGGEPTGEPGPGVAPNWTFRLDLDADRNPHTGADSGADFALTAGPDGRIALWRHESSRWKQTQTAPMSWTPSRIAFDLPASALDNEDGLADYVLDVGIRTSPSGTNFVRSASYAGSSSHVPDERMRVPAITRLRSEVKRGTLYLTGHLETRDGGAEAEYAPYRPGGWSLQVFLNTDRLGTGYWLGFDYIIRGVEWDPESKVSIVRRITSDPDYPGGWGPESGKATLRPNRGSFTIAIPLGAIASTEGDLDFALETYATVACPDCELGYSQAFAADYFGSSSANRRAPLASDFRPSSRAPTRWSLRPNGVRSVTADWTSPASATTR